MGNKNTNLQVAKNSKYVEFYTTYECIEKEMAHYFKRFKNQIVLCNCDDPFESNFCKYFLKNFNLLKLKRPIYLSYGMTQRGFNFNSIDEPEECLDRFEIKN